MRGNQLYNDRVFDDILMSEGVNTHYLPLRNVQGRREERGVDVWLALEAYELVLSGTIDIIVLIVSDTDYTPLMRKIRAAGIPIMLLSWEFEYLTDDGIKMVTKTSHELLSLPPTLLRCTRRLSGGWNKTTRWSATCSSQRRVSPETEHTVEVSEILSLKSGFGFIKYPNNNLFFHCQDVEGNFADLAVGDPVEFIIEKNQQKQDVAKHVRKLPVPSPEEDPETDM